MNNRDQKVDATSVFFVLCALYFMWGFITVLNFGLLDVWKNTNDELDATKVLFLIFVFFIVYFLMAIPAGKLINKLGFRKGIVTGAFVAAIGCFAMYPAMASKSFGVVAAALFVMASGITILQVAANPYVVLMGSGPARLSLCGGFNSLGALLATFATGKITKHLESLYQNLEMNQIKEITVAFVKTPYLILGGVWLLIGIVLIFSNLPSVVTHEMEPMVKNSDDKKSVFQFSHVILGAIGIFACVGVEVAIGNYLGIEDGKLSTPDNPVTFALYYFMAMMVGRFVGAVALSRIDGAKLNTAYALFAVVLILAFIMNINSGEGVINNTNAFYALVGLGFLNSILYPVIFSFGIDGIGKYTEEGSSLLVMGIGGGAIVPFVFMNLLGNSTDITSILLAFGLIAVCYLFIAFYSYKGYKYEKK